MGGQVYIQKYRTDWGHDIQSFFFFFLFRKAKCGFRGLTDKASASGGGDCGFKSHLGPHRVWVLYIPVEPEHSVPCIWKCLWLWIPWLICWNEKKKRKRKSFLYCEQSVLLVMEARLKIEQRKRYILYILPEVSWTTVQTGVSSLQSDPAPLLCNYRDQVCFVF